MTAIAPINQSLQIQPQQPKKRTEFLEYLRREDIQERIALAIGNSNCQRFNTAIVSAVTANHVLMGCEPLSIITAALMGESLNLSASLGQYSMLPMKTHKKIDDQIVDVYVVQFYIGANGYKQLAMRTQEHVDIDVMTIKQGELLGIDRMTGKPKFEFITDYEGRRKAPIIGYRAMFQLRNGMTKSLYMSSQEMLEHAERYVPYFTIAEYERFLKGGNFTNEERKKFSGTWYAQFDKMSLKTVIRTLLRNDGYLTPDLLRAIESDGTIIEDGAPQEQPIDLPEIEGEEEENKSAETPKDAPPQDNPTGFFFR